MRTNAILMKELIISKEKSDKIRHDIDITIRSDLPSQEHLERLGSSPNRMDSSPNNIYRSLTDCPGCKDCVRINSQLRTILALNNKMFIQMLDMCKQITNLSITVENSTNKVMKQFTQKTQH